MSEKPGRNSPCPCDSGKKYKQCCWNKRVSLGKRKFKATVISSKTAPDLIERTFSDALQESKKEDFPSKKESD